MFIRWWGAQNGGRYRERIQNVNTHELAQLDHWDDEELQELVTSFVRRFRRLPNVAELVRFRHSRAGLQMRLPARGTRTATPLLVTR